MSNVDRVPTVPGQALRFPWDIDVSGLTTAEAALAYFDAGLPIAPCSATGKPLVDEWNTREFTRDEIIEAWRKTPNAQILMVCGKRSGTVPVDLDVKNGKNALAYFEGDPLDYFGVVAATPSGGLHGYCLYDPAIRNQVNAQPFDGLEIRSDNPNPLGIYLPTATNGRKWLKVEALRPVPQHVIVERTVPERVSNVIEFPSKLLEKAKADAGCGTSQDPNDTWIEASDEKILFAMRNIDPHSLGYWDWTKIARRS